EAAEGGGADRIERFELDLVVAARAARGVHFAFDGEGHVRFDEVKRGEGERQEQIRLGHAAEGGGSRGRHGNSLVCCEALRGSMRRLRAKAVPESKWAESVERVQHGRKMCGLRETGVLWGLVAARRRWETAAAADRGNAEGRKRGRDFQIFFLRFRPSAFPRS